MSGIEAIATMVYDAERHADDLADDRIAAIEYYKGEMKDTPSDEGMSSLTTREVRSAVRKIMPSVMRTILGNDEVVEYQPKQMEDEQGAQQASDYVNFVIMPECKVTNHIYDAIHDALLLRNGILKWWWEDKDCPKVSAHTGLTEEEMLALAGEDVEVIEANQDEQGLYNIKIKRMDKQGRIMASAVPRERFLIHPDARTVQESILTGEKVRDVTRSDLVAMGYDRKLVLGLSQSEEDDEEEEYSRRDVAVEDGDEVTKENEKVDYYDLYVRIDLDDDGIAELRHMCFAGGLSEKNLLLNEECDEVQYCDLCAIREPHQWEGISIYDDTRDVQQANTVLLRQTIDNLYWQNNPQPMMQAGAIENPEALYNPEFGLPIEVKRGTDVREALGFNQVPFVAKDSFGMMEFMRNEAHERTGISDASAGMAPDALQNMTAKASAMIEAQGIGQTELIVRNLAEGLKTFFAGILRLTIRHQDKPRTVRLRNQWVEFDPRHWNADMDVTVNTGLGAGTRERDMMMMVQVLGIQERIIGNMGPVNPFVTPENLGNTLTKLVEAGGLKTPGMYFNEPSPEDVQQFVQQIQNQPNPEEMKLQAEMQAKQADMQLQMQMKQMDVQVQRDKERAQMEADLIVEEKRLAANAEEMRVQAQLDAAKEAQSLAFEREKLAEEATLKREDMAFQAQIEAIKASAPQGEGVPQGGNEEAFKALAEGMMQAASAPRRIVRDENGDVIGVETVQ